MACHDGTPYPEIYAPRLVLLFGVVDIVRDVYGYPLIVIDGYRSEAYNQKLILADEARGSHQVASGSEHVIGNAVDLRPSQGIQDIPKLLAIVLDLYAKQRIPALGGVGAYPKSNWVHIDVRPQVPLGHVARWDGV